MRDLREFLRRHIEAFLEHEFGEATKQNVTPPGCRRLVWTSDHTQRLVDHLAGNWGPVGDPWTDVPTFRPWDQRVLDEVAVDNAHADAAAAEYDATPEDEMPPVNPEVPW